MLLTLLLISPVLNAPITAHSERAGDELAKLGECEQKPLDKEVVKACARLFVVTEMG